MKSEPVVFFKKDKQLNTYLQEWQRVLFLDTWVITGELVDEIVDDNNYLAGHVELSMEHQTAYIRISTPAEKDTQDYMIKQCQEKTLVHELLHLKYNWLSSRNPSYSDSYMDVLEHQKLEEMARSLICAKYNIDRDWFKNS